MSLEFPVRGQEFTLAWKLGVRSASRHEPYGPGGESVCTSAFNYGSLALKTASWVPERKRDLVRISAREREVQVSGRRFGGEINTLDPVGMTPASDHDSQSAGQGAPPISPEVDCLLSRATSTPIPRFPRGTRVRRPVQGMDQDPGVMAGNLPSPVGPYMSLREFSPGRESCPVWMRFSTTAALRLRP